jgi:fibronectin-binding autotransporter adhesin
VSLSAGGSLDPGVYRVFNYAGALTDNGLSLGTMPAGTLFEVQTAIAGQVNLVNTFGQTMFFWDGPIGPKNDSVIQGGTGVWRLGGGDNDWTAATGAANSDFQQNAFAVFAGAPGTVTVDDIGGAIGISGMQFIVDGYTVTGDDLTLAATPTSIRVGDSLCPRSPFPVCPLVKGQIGGYARYPHPERLFCRIPHIAMVG